MGENSPAIEVVPLDLSGIHKAIKIHQKAFPGFFLSILGPCFLKLLYRFYIQGETEIAIACKYKGQIAGTLLGTTQPEGFYRRLALRHFPLFTMASLIPLLRQPSIFPRLIRAFSYRGEAPSSTPGAALLASVCVDPSYKGKGIGRKLLHAFDHEIFKLGARFAYLSTDRHDNKSVRRFYETLGWSVESEYITAEGRQMIRYWKKVSGRGKSR